MRVHDMRDLRGGVGVWIGPAPEREVAVPRAHEFAQLPCVLDAPFRTHVPVPAQDDERLESVLFRAVRIRETVVERVLAREKWNDSRTRDVGAEIRHEVPQIVLFAQADGAIGQEHEGPGACQPAHRMIGVDPCIHAGGGRQLRARWTQFRRNDRIGASQRVEKSTHEPFIILGSN